MSERRIRILRVSCKLFDQLFTAKPNGDALFRGIRFPGLLPERPQGVPGTIPEALHHPIDVPGDRVRGGTETVLSQAPGEAGLHLDRPGPEEDHDPARDEEGRTEGENQMPGNALGILGHVSMVQAAPTPVNAGGEFTIYDLQPARSVQRSRNPSALRNPKSQRTPTPTPNANSNDPMDPQTQPRA